MFLNQEKLVSQGAVLPVSQKHLIKLGWQFHNFKMGRMTPCLNSSMSCHRSSQNFYKTVPKHIFGEMYFPWLVSNIFKLFSNHWSTTMLQSIGLKKKKKRQILKYSNYPSLFVLSLLQRWCKKFFKWHQAKQGRNIISIIISSKKENCLKQEQVKDTLCRCHTMTIPMRLLNSKCIC